MPLCMHNSVMLTLLTARQNLPTAQQFFLSIDFSQLSLFGCQQAKHLWSRLYFIDSDHLSCPSWRQPGKMWVIPSSSRISFLLNGSKKPLRDGSRTDYDFFHRSIRSLLCLRARNSWTLFWVALSGSFQPRFELDSKLAVFEVWWWPNSRFLRR